MDIPNQVEKLWNDKEDYLEGRVCGWLKDLNKNQIKIEDARKTFRQWNPLRVYTNVSKAMSGTLEFSLRFHGQEVAKLRVNKQAYLCINEKKAASLKKYFSPPPPIPKGDVEWKSKEAAEFRKYFIDLDSEGKDFNLRSEEHRIESYIIKEMENQKKDKFNGKFRDIKPVKLYNKFPFQMPVPITGHTGDSYLGDGNIDILARRGKGGSTKLSIWELKATNQSSTQLRKAINQSLIYTSTIVMMLRSKCGEGWYKAFGFAKLPPKIKVEAVVVIHRNQKALFSELVEKQLGKNLLRIGDDEIIPCVAYYDDKYDIVEFKEKKQV